MAKFFAALLVSLAMIAGAGFYNYQRNAALDLELSNRSYANLSDADLYALIEAYTGEGAKLKRTLSGATGDPTAAMNGFAPGDLDGRLAAFNDFQKRNERFKRVSRAELQHRVMIEALEHERTIRARGLDDEWTRIRRRVLTF